MCARSRAETKKQEVIDNTWAKDEVLSKSHVTDSASFSMSVYLSLVSGLLLIYNIHNIIFLQLHLNCFLCS